MNDKMVWYIQKCEGAEYLHSILNFLVPEYIRIFGEEVMMTTPCVVYNDPGQGYPQFNHTNPLSICLSQSSFDFWTQTIYQLSHELCHYAIYQTKQDKTKTLSWFEEIVCEAMSLYALQYASENWHKCTLSKLNPDYKNDIRDYLDKLLMQDASDEFAQCNTLSKLRTYELNQRPENNRASHIAERNRIYAAISSNPEEAACFLRYQWYVHPENGITFDFTAWHQDDPRNMILQLFSVFPIKDEK